MVAYYLKERFDLIAISIGFGFKVGKVIGVLARLYHCLYLTVNNLDMLGNMAYELFVHSLTSP